MGIGVTDATGTFSISFDASKFTSLFDRSPDLYFIVKDAGTELLNTKDNVLKDANASTDPINLVVDLANDKLRKLINKEPVGGWVGGFPDLTKNPEMGYPTIGADPLTVNTDDPKSLTPDLSSLDIAGNLDNIPLLKRQWKVLWPEFSWNSEPDNTRDKKRCFQMFAPDISRLGYNDAGQVYSIICPQQGFASPHLGSMNVEITVTGAKGWADETTKEAAAEMGVEGKIWFGPSAHQNQFVKMFMHHFAEHGLSFPFNKDNAIRVSTFKPGEPKQPYFPLRRGLTTEFPIPNFANHAGIAWSAAHLSVQIGTVVQTDDDKVNNFNQMIVDIFNTAAGNMLKENNILTWNVWFTAPEYVNQEEWSTHAEYWRTSIDADHGSPEGEGTSARHADATLFEPLKEAIKDDLPKILAYIKKYL
ncbi:MAG: hypothetical protein AB8B69_23515 [Chitinophagales bacterium]